MLSFYSQKKLQGVLHNSFYIIKVQNNVYIILYVRNLLAYLETL